MKNFPHQYARLDKLTGALRVAAAVIDGGGALGGAGEVAYGEALSRAGLYTDRLGGDVDAMLRRDRLKPSRRQGTRTVAREMGRTLQVCGFLRLEGADWRVTERGREVLAAATSAATNAFWRDAMLAVTLGEGGAASHHRPLQIGNAQLQCYVLDDETRVLSEAEFLEAMGRHRKANVRDEGGEERTPPILQGKAVKPFISQELLEKSRPIQFITPTGTRASGYRAEILPMVCEVYLQARDALALPPNQRHVAKQAEILIRALAHVGIIALVDEATGYQSDRARDALSKILEAFIAKELQQWVKTFPTDYYQEMFRLRGLAFPRDTVKRPQYFGMLTNDLVYRRLAPGVLEELKRVTPKNDAGRPRAKLFQHLTHNVGYPKLREHLGAVVAIMKLSDQWPDFMAKMDRLHPRYGDTLQLPFHDQPEQDTGKGL